MFSPEMGFVGASAIGAAAGAAAEWQATRKAAEAQEAFVLPHLEAALQQDAAEQQAQANRRLTMPRFLSKYAIRAVLPVVTAGAVGIEAYSFMPHTRPDAKVATELVIDDSGPAQPVIGQIREVVAQFHNTPAEAIVGNTGNVITMSASKFGPYTQSIEGSPAGEAPLAQQISLGLNKVAESNRANQNNRGQEIVITNGNRVGPINSLISKANAQNTALNFVNVERQGASQTVIDGLKRSAHLTGGRFYDANSSNLGSVASDVKAKFAPDTQNVPKPDQWPYRITGLGLLAAAAAVYTSRKKLLMGRDPKGE